MKKQIVIIIILFLTISSCKKYEQGPYISFRTKKKRLCKEWIIEQGKQNKKIKWNYGDIVWNFNKDNSLQRIFTQNDSNVNADWNFSDNYDSLLISYLAYMYFPLLDSNGNVVTVYDSIHNVYVDVHDSELTKLYNKYCILELTNKELKIKGGESNIFINQNNLFDGWTGCFEYLAEYNFVEK